MLPSTIDKYKDYIVVRQHYRDGDLFDFAYKGITHSVPTSSKLVKEGLFNAGVVTMSPTTFTGNINIFLRATMVARESSATVSLMSRIATGTQEGFQLRIDTNNRLLATQYLDDLSGINTTTVPAGTITYGRPQVFSSQHKSNSIDGLTVYLNGVKVGNSVSTVGRTLRHRPAGSTLRLLGYAANQNTYGIITDVIIFDGVDLTEAEHLAITNELAYMNADTCVQQTPSSGYVVFKTSHDVTAQGGIRGGTIGDQFEASPFFFSDTTGRFKITTDTHNGRLVKVIECTTSPGAGQGLYLPYSYDATKWEYWYKASGATVYTQVTDNSRISASGEKTIFNMAIGDKMIYSDITGDICILKRRV